MHRFVNTSGVFASHRLQSLSRRRKRAGMVSSPSPNLGRAALWMGAALVSFSTMAVSGREAGRVLPTADMLVWRSVIGFVIVVAVLGFTAQGFAQLRTRRLGTHLTRNLGHFFGQYGWYTAVTLIPLAQVFALEFTAPIWVALVAPLFLGERFSMARLGSIGVSFLGVLLVVGAFGSGFAAAFGEGQVWALLASFGFAVTMISTKRLTGTETTLCIMFWLAVLQAPMGVILAGGLPQIPPDAMTALWVLALGVGGLSAHFCVAQAFRYGDATVVAPMDFFRLPLIALVGMVFYAEPLAWNVLGGGALIFFGNWLNTRRKQG